MRSVLTLATIAVMLVLSFLNLHHGDLNQDEGWYLVAARSVSEGKLPYRDFAYTQAPLLPFVYAPFTPWVRENGVMAGRMITQCFGWLAVFLAALLAARLSPGRRGSAFVFALMLAGINVFQSYYTTVVKTYGLCAALLAAGLLIGSWLDRRGRWWVAPLVGIVLALAAGARISAGLGLPVFGLYLLWRRRQLGDLAWFTFGLGGLAGLAAVFLPLYLAAPDGLVFGLVEYHAGRVAENPMVLKAGFLSRLAQDYFVAFAALAAIAVIWFWDWDRLRVDPEETEAGPRGFGWMLAVLLVAVSGLHLAAAFPYDDYQAIVFPLFAALLAVPLARLHELWVLPLVFLLATASAFSSPINQDWFVRGRDRVWWKNKETADLALLRDTADRVRELAAGSGDTNAVLLTQDAYLAIEADLPLPPGLEMGPFSYYPDLRDEEAATLHLHNRSSLSNLLSTTEAPVAALSGYSLSIGCPEVEELPEEERQALRALIEARYEPAFEVPHFGQGHTTLEVWKRKP